MKQPYETSYWISHPAIWGAVLVIEIYVILQLVAGMPFSDAIKNSGDVLSVVGAVVAVVFGALINAELNRKRDDRLRAQESLSYLRLAIFDLERWEAFSSAHVSQATAHAGEALPRLPREFWAHLAHDDDHQPTHIQAHLVKICSVSNAVANHVLYWLQQFRTFQMDLRNDEPEKNNDISMKFLALTQRTLAQLNEAERELRHAAGVVGDEPPEAL